MKSEYYLSLLEQCGAILKGHFLLTSGLHSDTYIEKFKVLQFPALCDQLCRGIADHFAATKPGVVLGAATGGIVISHSVARFLNTRTIFAEREESNLTLRRGFSIGEGERVLIVDDVVTTGGSIFELIDLVLKHKGLIVGIGVIINRSETKIDFGFPFYPLISLTIPAYRPEACPQCAANVPLTSRGRTGKK